MFFHADVSPKIWHFKIFICSLVGPSKILIYILFLFVFGEKLKECLPVKIRFQSIAIFERTVHLSEQNKIRSREKNMKIIRIKAQRKVDQPVLECTCTKLGMAIGK